MINRNLEGIIIGAALIYCASALLPIAKTTLSSAGRIKEKAWPGIRTVIQTAREEMEDIFAEAQFERMRKQIDKEILH
ncbi:hypothetical protein [Aneurinibacillus terranovensis]|uniref:hypothetical protein n=1 Tax=Aneurinibacillus terranovensis TaxID=278991 RepID=UPI0003F509F4|nr:hypothetical protein [Aneurinibacillus terranovensis]